MEEAYTALYQEFLRLRSLCLKQAAMLQQLTKALEKQQGMVHVPYGGLDNQVSSPLKRSQDGFELCSKLNECNLQVVQRQTPVALPCGNGEVPDMTKGTGHLKLQHGQAEVEQSSQDGTLPQDPAAQNGSAAPTNILDELRQAEQRWHNSQTPTVPRRPWSSSVLDSLLVSQGGGLMMSGTVLQSQVCDFCQAVFPAHTATKGEFLRHLTAHIT